MGRKLFILLFVFFSCVLNLSATTTTLDKLVQISDSLILSGEYEHAKAITDSANSLVTKQNNIEDVMEIKLSIMLQQADIFVNQSNMDIAIKQALKVVDLAQNYNYPEIKYKAHLTVALINEIMSRLDACNEHLNIAFALYQQYKFDNLYSTYCIRKSSYYRFRDNIPLAIENAKLGLKYAQQYHVKKDIADGYLLLGILFKKETAIYYTSLAAQQFIKNKNYSSTAMMYNNISITYLKLDQLMPAILYNDTAIYFSKNQKNYDIAWIYYNRSRIFEKNKQLDSALLYYKKYDTVQTKLTEQLDFKSYNEVKEKYENDKKTLQLKAQNQLIIFIGSLLTLITIAIILLYRKNREIIRKNETINKQMLELNKTVAQKQVLLSELQHRVKNNLQHVISILEIQKESVNFNTIEELIRGNQNRIHSLALLHKKLNILESANDVYLCKYVNELANLVKDSYGNKKKEIQLNFKCNIEKIAIEKALPIGLIIVELVSNSMKYAFENLNIGIISIELIQNENEKNNRFYYADNGIGFDFNTNIGKGLGLEIIKGLIDQLDGTIQTTTKNGFELTILFK